ncbi:putative monooxygenase [Diaporthe sp. PMI_573]|nr:putative monooxygenase [Diaporthaceae sp. PMI_573]
MAPKTYPHVLIVGAGLSGLTLAQVLRKNGVSYEIFERDKSAEARAQGWAIALHGPVLADLKEHMPDDIGPIECTNHLTPLDLPAQFVFYHAKNSDMRVGVEDDDKGKIVRANRQRLRDWLRTHIPVQYDRRVLKVDEEGEKITVHFENGSSATGDILVGAEGTRSAIRKHILRGQDVMRPLPIGSLVGEIELTGDDFARQLELAHSAYVVIDNGPASLFAALNKVSPDGKLGYWYFILHWVDAEAAKATDENPFWTVNASREELAAFVREKVKDYPDHLRVLVDKTPVERYRRPGIVLQGVELSAEQLPAQRVMVIGDAAHSMTPFRGEAGINALQDGVTLGRTIARIRDTQASGADFEKMMGDFRDDMLGRGARAIRVSNPVLEEHSENPNREWITCSKVAVPLPKETITIEK